MVTENLLLRLVFHDCIPYLDGSGGCDGCLSWDGMIPTNECKQQVNECPFNSTDNSGLDKVAENLEKIYTTIDWPFIEPINSNLAISLYQSGKSRADLWQLAGLVALEQSIERANRACDLDYFSRQQVSKCTKNKKISSNS